MEGKLLLTVEVAAQVGTDLLIAPFLPADQYEYDLDWIKRIKIVKPDDQVLEKEADFGRAFDAPNTYILLLSNTQAVEVPIGSQIWI